MITSTLPTLPGNQPFDVLGVVGGIGGGQPPSAAWENARRQLEAQAEALGADAVIDVHCQIVPTDSPRGSHVLVCLVGTAVKYAFTHA